MAVKSKSFDSNNQIEIFPESDQFLLTTHPRKNTKLIGHLDTANIICNLFNQNKAPHAFLLTGKQGIGKATFVYNLIKALERKGNDIQPQDIFDVQHDKINHHIEKLSFGNLQVLRREYNVKEAKLKKTITIDDWRGLKSFFEFKPHGDGKRYIVIDSFDDCVHGINSVPNALLKILEEPPKNCYFFMINHKEGLMLPTIRSRCMSIRMSELNSADMKTILQHIPHFHTIDIDRVLDLAKGSVRSALIYSDNFWYFVLTQIKKALYKGISASVAIPIQKLKDKSFDKILQSSDFYLILQTILVKAISDNAKFSLSLGLHDCVFASGVIFEKINLLFIKAEEYNFTSIELLDRMLKIIDYYHFIKKEVSSACR